MDERPDACPACGGTALIRSGHACGRQRWKCKGLGCCGRQFTRAAPRRAASRPRWSGMRSSFTVRACRWTRWPSGSASRRRPCCAGFGTTRSGTAL